MMTALIPHGDNKTVQAMRLRSRTSLEKSARNAGVKNIGHKNKLELARGIDRARKDRRNERERVVRFTRRSEEMRAGKYRPSTWNSRQWEWYKELMGI